MAEHREADSTKYSIEGAKEAPLVSCVMITGKDAKHEELARKAIVSFQQQTYPNKELVIINDGDYALYRYPQEPARNVREIRCIKGEEEPKLTLGALRNLGLKHSEGEWICQWDDDDWSHPHRISMMMAVRREGHCVLLRRQIRYSSFRNTAYVCDCEPGHAGTILHPAQVEHPYPEQPLSEDAVFWVDNWGDNRIVLDNNSGRYPGPALYLRFFHGNNSWDEQHVMRNYVGKGNLWAGLNEDESYYLKQTLQEHYGFNNLQGVSKADV